MPVYFFTYHAYGTWLPDRPRGYTRPHADVRPPDPAMAKRYRENMTDPPASFPRPVQRLLIEELTVACARQGYEPHAIGTDKTHLHVLVSWTTPRPWLRVRAGLQYSMSKRLNQDILPRKWFVANPSRKRVSDRTHYDYLVSTYIPNHRGWKWDRRRGFY